MPATVPPMWLGKRSLEKQGGFTLVAVLAALALLALATERVVFVLWQQAQREREAELLRVGVEFVRAIGSYHESSPGSLKAFPRELSELVEDSRFLGVKRHLRRIYEDPVGGGPWELVRGSDGGIVGVRSASQRVPIRSGAMELDGLRLPAAQRYAEWEFVYKPGMPSHREQN